MKLSVSSINNTTALQQMMALGILGGNGSDDSSSQDLASLLGTGDTSDISAEGELLSNLGLQSSDAQDQLSTLESDFSSIGDPSKLSDDDVKSFMTKLKTDLGSLPGALSTYDPANMSDADVENARNALVNMKSLADEASQNNDSTAATAYSKMSATQKANYIALLQQADEVNGLDGSSSNAGLMSLLTSYNPNSGSSSTDSTSSIYNLLSSYDQVSMGNMPNVSLADIMNTYEENASQADPTQNNVDYSV